MNIGIIQGIGNMMHEKSIIMGAKDGKYEK